MSVLHLHAAWPCCISTCLSMMHVYAACPWSRSMTWPPPPLSIGRHSWPT
jgi:hypothetical protein